MLASSSGGTDKKVRIWNLEETGSGLVVSNGPELKLRAIPPTFDPWHSNRMVRCWLQEAPIVRYVCGT